MNDTTVMFGLYSYIWPIKYLLYMDYKGLGEQGRGIEKCGALLMRSHKNTE
jgi:hypothetical protein